MDIEAEVRSFITQDEYDRLLSYFQTHATLQVDDEQETWYFDCDQDVRIQKNTQYSKIWMKKGNMHDDAREEVEIKVDIKDFDKLKQLFETLGHNVQIKWLRKRMQFVWDDITVCLDHTKGYGYILELEKMCDAQSQDATHTLLKEKLASLDIGETPKEVFAEKYNHYKKNWKRLLELSN